MSWGDSSEGFINSSSKRENLLIKCTIVVLIRNKKLKFNIKIKVGEKERKSKPEITLESKTEFGFYPAGMGFLKIPDSAD